MQRKFMAAFDLALQCDRCRANGDDFTGGEVTQCRFWLEREIAAVRPKLVVALGATAMLALTGRASAVTKERGRILSAQGHSLLVTVHPSYLLRLPDPDVAEQEYRRFVDDLRLARPWSEAA